MTRAEKESQRLVFSAPVEFVTACRDVFQKTFPKNGCDPLLVELAP